jgi:hypothetical protein
MGLLNPYQEACARVLGEGSDCEDVGDTLFVFLMRELSASEDCDSQGLRQAIEDVETVLAEVEKL